MAGKGSSHELVIIDGARRHEIGIGQELGGGLQAFQSSRGDGLLHRHRGIFQRNRGSCRTG